MTDFIFLATLMGFLAVAILGVFVADRL